MKKGGSVICGRTKRSDPTQLPNEEEIENFPKNYIVFNNQLSDTFNVRLESQRDLLFMRALYRSEQTFFTTKNQCIHLKIHLKTNNS